MIDARDPLGLDGFAFCEFTSPDPAAMSVQFEQPGVVAAARRPDRGLTLYRQGRIALVLNQGEGHAAPGTARCSGSDMAVARRRRWDDRERMKLGSMTR